MLYEVNGTTFGLTPARMLRAIDGDTVELQVKPTGPLVDLGFGVKMRSGPIMETWLKARVRLIALNTGPIFSDPDGTTDTHTLEKLADPAIITKINAPEVHGPSRDAGMQAKHYVHETLFNKGLLLFTPEKPMSFNRWIGAILYPGFNEGLDGVELWYDLGNCLRVAGHATTL